jgi:hypothetical protein
VGKADNLTAICELIVLTMWDLQHLTTLLFSAGCYEDSLIFLLSGHSHSGNEETSGSLTSFQVLSGNFTGHIYIYIYIYDIA